MCICKEALATHKLNAHRCKELKNELTNRPTDKLAK